MDTMTDLFKKLVNGTEEERAERRRSQNQRRERRTTRETIPARGEGAEELRQQTLLQAHRKRLEDDLFLFANLVHNKRLREREEQTENT
jgi:hypothetical protein